MNQEEIFGTGSLEKLKDILINTNYNKIFLVIGKNSFSFSGAEERLKKILNNYKTEFFSEISEPPCYNFIDRGIEAYKKFNPNLIISVGGGSVIDTAKLIKFFAPHEFQIKEYFKRKIDIKESFTPLIAIPTTSGTGSESTQFAVLFIDGKKYSVDQESILPNICIIDPILSFSMPRKVAAISGMDALSQAVESYWGVNSTEESKNFSSESIKLIINNIENAVLEKDQESMEAMSKGAHLSGKAINITRTTAPHALSYFLTSKYKIPHGEAVAITLSEFLIQNSILTNKTSADSRGKEYVEKTINEIVHILGCSDTQEAKNKLEYISRRIGLRVRLSECGIKREDIEKILDNVNFQRLKNNPKIFERKELLDLLESVL